MRDLILEKIEQGLCPVCCKSVNYKGAKTKMVTYKGKKILVCRHHRIPGGEIIDV